MHLREIVPGLRREGREWHGPCPFCAAQSESHDGPARSFVVFPDEGRERRGRYLCRRCGETGDAIDYVRARHGDAYGEALERLRIEEARPTRARALYRRATARARLQLAPGTAEPEGPTHDDYLRDWAERFRHYQNTGEHLPPSLPEPAPENWPDPALIDDEYHLTDEGIAYLDESLLLACSRMGAATLIDRLRRKAVNGDWVRFDALLAALALRLTVLTALAVRYADAAPLAFEDVATRLLAEGFAPGRPASAGRNAGRPDSAHLFGALGIDFDWLCQRREMWALDRAGREGILTSDAFTALAAASEGVSGSASAEAQP